MPNQSRLTYVERPSPNFNERNGESVQILVLHYTAMNTAEEAIEHLCDPKTEVSAHYVIDEQGVIYRLVAEDKRAWHAGVSFWDGLSNLNSSSVGIEISNPGDIPYPKEQMDSVVALSKEIVARYKIRPFRVVAHSDIAPDRKQDPGSLFDWPGCAALGVGAYPAPVQRDYDVSKSWTQDQLTKSLSKLGFQSGVDLKILVTAFQRHFQPEVFKTPELVGIADAETKARLACLIRRKAISDGIAASKKKAGKVA